MKHLRDVRDRDSKIKRGDYFTKSALREYPSAPSRKAGIRRHGSRHPESTRSNAEEVVYAPSN